MAFFDLNFGFCHTTEQKYRNGFNFLSQYVKYILYMSKVRNYLIYLFEQICCPC